MGNATVTTVYGKNHIVIEILFGGFFLISKTKLKMTSVCLFGI